MPNEMMPGQEPGMEEAPQEGLSDGQAEQFFQAVSMAMSKAGEALSKLPGASDSVLQKIDQAQSLYQEAVEEALGGGQEPDQGPVSMEGGAGGIPEGQPA